MTQGLTLEPYLWRKRLILLFAPSAENETYRAQTKALEVARAGLDNRDLVVFHLLSDGSGRSEEKSPAQDEIAALQDRFKVAKNAFTFVLIGKDGTVKRRAEEPVKVDDLFAQIDTMPMRRCEMKP